MGLRRPLTFVGVVVLAFLIKTIVVDFRVFEPIQPYSTISSCRRYNVTGPEDVQIDHKTGIAYISSAEHVFVIGKPSSNPESHVYALDLASNKLTEMKLINHPRKTLTRSHGMSLYRDNDRLLMYLIDHTAAHDVVDVFEVRGDELHYLDSVHDALLFNLNDVVAVSAHEFYATTDHASIAPPHSQTAQLIETALHGTRSWLSYCDTKTKQCTAALSHIEYPNGIAASRDYKTIYYTSTTDGQVHAYTHNTSHHLVHKESAHVDVGLDNIDIDEHNRMWITNHPKPLHLLAYMLGFAKQAPGRVWRQKSTDKLEFEIVFETHGDDISGPSTTVAWHEHVLIGSVKSHFLHCKSNK